jgi:hypothetical protein
MAPKIFPPTILFSRALTEFLPLARWVSPTDASSLAIVSWRVHVGSPATGMVGGFILGNNLGE